ncbi:hypothetical protein LSCM4_07977 [Leishmania orientalis]|uniref:Uncharacterized protein n=1 Tax=Leishmania orientalis TaxID=2249476 RepID=A0A836HHU4_9TRYP|nr:hypothetical protein LSCM4_07977 [Leishmania orientalis]
MASSLSPSAPLLSHSDTMHSTAAAAAAVTEAAEQTADVALDEYFEACRASSSSALSSRSSSPSASESVRRLTEPSPRGATAGDRSGSIAACQRHHLYGVRDGKPAAPAAAGHPSPLQGNVTRPLLQRPRPQRSPLFADVLISIPRTVDEEGVPPQAASPPRSSGSPVHSFPKPELATPPGRSATASSNEDAATRGAAGRTLAERLQSTTLPYAPSSCLPSLSSAVAHSSAVPAECFRSAFAFQSPPPPPSAGAAATRGKKCSFTTITTRGGPGCRSSSASPSTAPHAAVAAPGDRLARQRAVLFDVLCALRQQPTASCEMRSDRGGSHSSTYVGSSCGSYGNSWRMRGAVLAEAATEAWSPTFVGALEQLLDMANDVAAVDAHVHECGLALMHHVSRDLAEARGAFAHEVAEECRGVQDASVALETAAVRALERLCSVLRQLSADFDRWLLQVQEHLVVVCEGAAVVSRRNGTQPPPLLAKSVPLDLHNNEEATPKVGVEREYPFGTDLRTAASCGVAPTVLPASCSLADLVAAVRENIVPLQRCRVLVEESGCFEGLVGFAKSSATSSPVSTTGAAVENAAGGQVLPRSPTCAVLAARLLDTLIVQASAFQDTSMMDLYRFYVTILLYTAWPYVLLCTAAIFGFVRGIDPPVWRQQLPRLFRSSFSHVHIDNGSRRCPTDILSLLLNCVGYYNADDVVDSVGARAKGKGVAQRIEEPLPPGAGRSGESVDTLWASAPRPTGVGSTSRRCGDVSEQHVARAALTSARTFVLRSLASFTRRRKQVALSRTPMHPRRALASAAGAKGDASATATAAAATPATSRASAGTAPCQPWPTKSVKEILRYIMYEAGDRRDDEPGDGGQADSGAVSAVVAYAQQNQDVRRRFVQSAAPMTALAAVDGTGCGEADGSTGTLHYAYFPTTIPLGFASMLAEALAGQQQWQQRRGDCCASSVADEQGHLSPSPLASSPRQRRASGDGRGSGTPPTFAQTSRRNANAAMGSINGDDGSGVLRRRGISLWTLAISESVTTPDVRFTNALAEEEEQYLDAPNEGGPAFSQGQRKQRSHQLWINVTIPCARWITAALLIPIGVAVQRLQERRLNDLFKMSLHAVVGGGGSGSGCFPSYLQHESVQVAQQQQLTDATALAERPLLGSLALPNGLAGTGLMSYTNTACSFIHALKLLVDVALCRDQERLVHGFLERLHREPRWWVRHAEDGGAAMYGRLGTAAPVVSAIFADALRGKRFSNLVRLAVLPARMAAADAAANSPAAATRTTPGQEDGGGRGCSSPSATAEMLDVFASFQLNFALPDAFERILQPRDLSVYVQPLTNTTMRSYQTYFWQRRRRLYTDAGDVRDGKSPLAATAEAGLSGVALSDVWSYVFGYQCALYYAQITLRAHKKWLHQRDTQDAQVVQAMGPPGKQATRHLQHVSRGLGSAYYTLNFAVEQLLSFTQNVAIRVVYDLERLLAKAMGSSRELLSCMELCYKLDALLLELSFVSFSARPPVALNVRERGMQSPAAEAVRAAVQRTLEVAFDPSCLPASHIRSSTRNAVEALVAAVSAAAEHHQSALATHLQPLVVRLTFNRHYGTHQETLSFRFR